MSRLIGVVLIAIAVLLPFPSIAWIVSSGFLGSHLWFGPKALGGVLLTSVVCLIAGLALIAPSSKRGGDA